MDFFNKGFKASKCKTLLKLTIPRIKLLRNRREIQLKQMRRDIAKLLETGQEATARIRVEHVIREEKMTAAQEIVELFCELIAVRLPIIEAQRECPLDLKEAISSICFAAPRCPDLTELLQVQTMFAGKYGKEFVAAATELRPECDVNRQLVELLSVRAPSPDAKLKLLKEITEENQLDWDPSGSASELLKPHGDLLNGPSQFVSGSKLTLPKDEPESPPKPDSAAEYSDSDSEYEFVDFPEVPQQPPHSDKGRASAPEMLPFPASALTDSDNDEDELNPCGHLEQLSRVMQEKSAAKQDDAASFPKKGINLPHPIMVSEKESDVVDLSDVLTAAQDAAKSAEYAAAAARSAASIAQLRINELSMKKSDDDNTVLGSPTENPFYHEQHKSHVKEPTESLYERSTYLDSDKASTSPNYDDCGGLNSTNGDFEFSSEHFDSSEDRSSRQPQRLPSMDDESFFAYPNLFASQGLDSGSRSRSFTDTR